VGVLLLPAKSLCHPACLPIYVGDPVKECCEKGRKINILYRVIKEKIKEN
jgi:hypothetical protein